MPKLFFCFIIIIKTKPESFAIIPFENYLQMFFTYCSIIQNP